MFWTGGPQVIAASWPIWNAVLLKFEILFLYCGNIDDEGVATIAPSLRSNRRLKLMNLTESNITATGWNAFLPVLCDSSSINATHGSNHTLQSLGDDMPHDIETLLRRQDKSLVAAKKILQTHPHLDMKTLFDWGLDLLPHARLDLKLSSIFQFVRAMPMEVSNGIAGKKKEAKRRRYN